MFSDACGCADHSCSSCGKRNHCCKLFCGCGHLLPLEHHCNYFKLFGMYVRFCGLLVRFCVLLIAIINALETAGPLISRLTRSNWNGTLFNCKRNYTLTSRSEEHTSE